LLRRSRCHLAAATVAVAAALAAAAEAAAAAAQGCRNQRRASTKTNGWLWRYPLPSAHLALNVAQPCLYNACYAEHAAQRAMRDSHCIRTRVRSDDCFLNRGGPALYMLMYVCSTVVYAINRKLPDDCPTWHPTTVVSFHDRVMARRTRGYAPAPPTNRAVYLMPTCALSALAPCDPRMRLSYTTHTQALKMLRTFTLATMASDDSMRRDIQLKLGPNFDK
jgi:hypothetical protein